MRTSIKAGNVVEMSRVFFAGYFEMTKDLVVTWHSFDDTAFRDDDAEFEKIRYQVLNWILHAE